MAAAMARLSGRGDPQTVATTFVTRYNGLSDATITTFNNPPVAGPHSSSAHYYEVVVTCPVTTLFMPVLGASQSQSVQARAVAGYETVSAGEVVGVLDSSASPGLAVAGGASLVVNGRIDVNSMASPAATVAGGGQVQAAVYHIAGPATSGTFLPYTGTDGRLALNHPPMADPLINLPTPATTASTANNTATPLGPRWSSETLGSPTVDAKRARGLQSRNYVDATGTVQLYPGVYQSISVSGGVVNLNPGVYILSPPDDTPYALDVSGATVTGDGVMFYNTGGDYIPSTGHPDYDDASLYDPGPSGTNAPPSSQGSQADFAGIRLAASNSNQIRLSALTGNNDPFDGILIYQRRANLRPIEIDTGNLSLVGTLYAKWAQVRISGGGSYQAQFIAGSMQLSGQAPLTLNYRNAFGKANEVFLVE
jgi:hypothetical protein